jgi:hypothetical protein
MPVRYSSTGFSNSSNFSHDETAYSVVLSPMLKSSNNCNTDPLPQADFSYTRSADHSNEITFTNKSSNASNYYWDFGNGQTSSNENPGAITYERETTNLDYTVSLKAYNADGENDVLSKTVTIPGDDEIDAPITISGANLSTNNDYSITLSFNEITGESDYKYDVTFYAGDGTSTTYNNQSKNSVLDISHTYETPVAGGEDVTYNPYVVVVAHDGDGKQVGEDIINFDPVKIDAPGLASLDVSITNSIDKLYINIPFNVTATVNNGSKPYDFTWIIYNSKVPNDFSRTTNANSLFLREPWQERSSTFSDLNFPLEGEYLIDLVVCDHNFVCYHQEFTLRIIKGSECLWAQIYLPIGKNGRQIVTYRKGSKICIQANAGINYPLDHQCDCTDPYMTDGRWNVIYDDIGRIDWNYNNYSSQFKKCVDGFWRKIGSGCFDQHNQDLNGRRVSALDYFNLDKAGVFTLSCTAYGANRGGYDCSNKYCSDWLITDETNAYGRLTVKATIEVVDCNTSIDLKTKSDMTNNMINNSLEKGTINILPTSTIDVIKSEIFEFAANNTVHVTTGFHAAPESNVHFKIEPCPPLINCIESKETEILSENVANKNDQWILLARCSLTPIMGYVRLKLTHKQQLLNKLM